jgi:hypothetical protein
MKEPDNRSLQPIPVKLVLPRWLIRGAIIYVIVCVVMLIPLSVIAVYNLIQSRKGYPPEEQRRVEQRRRVQLEEVHRDVEERLHPSPSPSPVRKVSQ